MNGRKGEGVLALDASFGAQFFILPDRHKGIEQLIQKLGFPLPQSAEDLGTFLTSEEGVLFRLGFTQVARKIIGWAKHEFSNHPTIDRLFAAFIHKYFNYNGADAGLNITYFPTYRQAAPYLQGIVDLLDHPRIPHDVKRKNVFELIRALSKCFPGFYSRAYESYTEMIGYLQLQEEFMAYRSQIASNVALNLIRQLPANLPMHPGNEIHYANRLMQDFSSQLCIHVNEDTLNRGDKRIVGYLAERFPDAVSAAMNLETFLDYLISKLQLDDAYTKANEALTSANMEAFNDIVNDFSLSVRRFGDGEFDTNRIFIFADDYLSLQCISFESRAYMFAFLMQRLIESGVVNRHVFTLKTIPYRDLEIEVRYIPYHSLMLASVRVGNGDPQSFLQFYLENVLDGEDVVFLDSIIAEKNNLYVKELCDYILGYLNQSEVLNTAVLEPLVSVLAQFGCAYFNEIMKNERLPKDLQAHYIQNYLLSEFPRKKFDLFYLDAMQMYIKLGHRNGLLLVKALTGHNVDLQKSINQDGDTILHFVCKNGTAALVYELHYIVEGEWRPNNERVTPLMQAFAANNKDTAQELMLLRPDLVSDTDIAGLTPLHYACTFMECDEVLLELMLDYGVDVNAVVTVTTIHSGLTALHIAVGHDSADWVRCLIDAGANLNLIYNSYSALDLACERECMPIIHLLLDADVEIDTASKQFNNLFRLLCVDEMSICSRKVLLAALEDYRDRITSNKTLNVFDITKTQAQNFRLFYNATRIRSAIVFVTKALLRRLTDRNVDHSQPYCASMKERNMLSMACDHSEELRQFINCYDGLVKRGLLSPVMKGDAKESNVVCLPGFGSPERVFNV